MIMLLSSGLNERKVVDVDQKFLVIQTAFIGDVVLATGIIEKLHQYFPDARIDFLVRSGNEGLLLHHPYLQEVIIWEKRKNKFSNLWKTLVRIRRGKYSTIINVQRFAATGLLTTFSGAKQTIGFDKNPFSSLFTHKIKHVISDGTVFKHEVDRNHDLIRDLTDGVAANPKLYPSPADYLAIAQYRNGSYISISPASVWFTKQYPKEKWIAFINKVAAHYTIYLLGSGADAGMAEEIKSSSSHSSIINLCGKLSYLQSAALMQDAKMNYVNDSAPLHFASAMNAPVTAVYCSTLPSFGFGPLSDKSFIVEIQEKLFCRPCGLHGLKACPLGHFKCAYKIEDEQLLWTLREV